MENIEGLKSLSKFRGQVLNRIYKVWLFRKFMPVFLAEIIVLSFVLYKLGKVLFIQKIMENAMDILFQNPSGIFNFIYSAFENANTLTKTLTIFLVIFIALFIRLLTQGFLRLLLVRKNYFGKTNQQ